jgi:phosphate transport system substrate-binding protein
MRRHKSSRRSKRLWYSAVLAAALVTVAVGLAACGSSNDPASASSSPAAAAGSSSFVGSGSTFAQPLYTAWAQTYQGVAGDKLNYQGVGSTAGIAAIEGKTVQFGATDAPLTESDLQTNGLVQFPTAVGGTVVIVNVSGVTDGKLTLNGATLADIYLGKITKWNDDAIKALNPGLSLPSTPIHVVHRSDGSGTSWIFTSYLSAVSPTWKSQVGADKSPSWPAGAGAAKSAGVAALVHQLTGSLGYVEYSYAKLNGIPTAKLVNADGNTLAPTIASFAAAAKNATWDASQGFAQALVNEPGATAWPITGATYALVQKDQPSAATGKTILKFFDWGYKSGAAQAQSLDYVPIPVSVYTMAEQQWSQITAGGSPVWP